MRDLCLNVPTFARIDEYFGLWAIEPVSAHRMFRDAYATDFAKHLAAAMPAKPVQSSLEMIPVKGGKNIAYVKAAGTLMKQQSSMGGTSTVQLRRDIRSAANDPNVQSILLGLDSPGGTVAGTADLAAEVKAARKKKAVWAHVDDLTASAAYWVASQASAIYANAGTALIGSIGTIVTLYDQSAAAEREGVRTLVFATGPLKGLGTPGAPVTDEQASHMQTLVNEMQTHFDAAVMKGRGFTASQLDKVRTGGVFPATEALTLRLIDGIRSLDATVEALSSVR